MNELRNNQNGIRLRSEIIISISYRFFGDARNWKQEGTAKWVWGKVGRWLPGFTYQIIITLPFYFPIYFIRYTKIPLFYSYTSLPLFSYFHQNKIFVSVSISSQNLVHYSLVKLSGVEWDIWRNFDFSKNIKTNKPSL